jgi:hypothetical protein
MPGRACVAWRRSPGVLASMFAIVIGLAYGSARSGARFVCWGRRAWPGRLERLRPLAGLLSLAPAGRA